MSPKGVSAGDPSRSSVHVVAGVLRDITGRVLIAQRPTGTHLAGGWEFPGGKLEAGEQRAVGLAREFREELGILVHSSRPLMRVRHAYPARNVLLDVWVVTNFSGEPRGLDGQALRWCTWQQLTAAALLPADKPIVSALRLPEKLTQPATAHYVIEEQALDRAAQCEPHTRLRGVFCSGIVDALAACHLATGTREVDFLVMREELPRADLEALCAAEPIPVFARGLTLEEAWNLGACGVSELNPQG